MSVEQRVETLAATIRGRVLRPGDDAFDSARHIWNGMIDRKPALIVQCAGTADVIRTINFASEQRAPLAVRSGGHSAAGSSVCDDGVMLDLSMMKGIRVDPERRTVSAQPGLTWAEFD